MALAPQHTVGRIFDTDWSVANIARLLKFNAARGMLRKGAVTGGNMVVQLNYLRTASARHLPTSAVVTFTRDEEGNCWHAAITFADREHYLPWNDAVAEEWLVALFGAGRPNVAETVDANLAIPQRHFRLPA